MAQGRKDGLIHLAIGYQFREARIVHRRHILESALGHREVR